MLPNQRKVENSSEKACQVMHFKIRGKTHKSAELVFTSSDAEAKIILGIKDKNKNVKIVCINLFFFIKYIIFNEWSSFNVFLF